MNKFISFRETILYFIKDEEFKKKRFELNKPQFDNIYTLGFLNFLSYE